jgi:cytochrome c biogenesis protein CcmG/thiol:disulfide interchange protein DsbE
MATDLTLDPPRRRIVVWIAAAVAVMLAGLIAVLVAADPATTRTQESPLVGRIAPAVQSTTIDGQDFDLDLQRGQWVVVNFFATWCVPCRREHPELVAFADRHADIEDAVVLGVVYDDDLDAVRRFREAEGGDWPMVDDSDGRIALSFGVSGVPESFIVDPAGRVVAKVTGGVRADELDELIASAVAGR